MNLLYNNMTRRPPGYNEMLTEFGTYINETYEKNISDAYQMMTIEEITNKHLYNYILYNYYKSKLEEKVETFGRAKINAEKKYFEKLHGDILIRKRREKLWQGKYDSVHNGQNKR